MKFRKYNSIDNSYREKTINYIYENGFTKGEWFANEKIHGANFSFHSDGKEVRPAKRTSFLSPNENFFNYQPVFEKYKDKVKLLAKRLVESFNYVGGIETVAVYGELYGGTYPHPDVEKNNDAVLIQRGVYYTPHNDWIAFDVCLINSKGDRLFLNYEDAIIVLEEVRIPYVDILFEGSFEDCLKHDNAFQTKIPKRHNLPEIKDNICEGIVIRPKKEKRFPTGSRVLLKSKNEKFKEKKARRKPKPSKKLNKKEQEVYNEICEYITENRLNNVISKIGEITDKDFGKIMGMFSSDVFEEYTKDSDKLKKLDKDRRKKINKKLGRELASFVRPHFVRRI